MTDPRPSPHPLSYSPPPARQSRAGIISFACGLIAPLCLFLSLMQLIAFLIFPTLVVVVALGLVTGILGVRSTRHKRGLAIIGLILNGLISVLISLLTIFGWLGLG